VRAAALAALLLALAGAGAVPAAAAPPPNDGPAGAADTTPVTAANQDRDEDTEGADDAPDEQEGVAELAEATADAGAPRCLGPDSFARTVWFRVPAADTAREVGVEASGRTSDVLDLAAFVQPAGAVTTALANGCGGAGVGGADASEDPTAGVLLRVPAGRSVLLQVGRRGAPAGADDERALLSVAARPLGAGPRPAGDEAGSATPALQLGQTATVPVGRATTTEEDPATVPCPALGSVFRRIVPERSGPLTVTADGAPAGTLTLFAGERPTGANATGCVNRERSTGALVLGTEARAGVPVWVRVGTDRPAAGAAVALRVDAARAPVDGGPGGGAPEDVGAGDSGPVGPPPPGSPDGAGRPGAGAGGANPGGAGSAPGGPRTPAAGCVAGGGFRTVGVAPGRRGRLGLTFTRAVSRPVTVDVFQQSVGRRVIGERLVARFTGRARTVAWNGRANRPGRRVADGYLFVRYRIAGDVRRVTLRRVRGRFTRRPDFFRRSICGPLTTFKLTRPVFGGQGNRAVAASYRLAVPGRVTLEVLRGGRVVRRYPARSERAGRTIRRRFDAEGRGRGDHRFRLRVQTAAGTVTATLTSRRL